MELFRALAALAEPPSDVGLVERLAGLLGLGGPPSPSEYTEAFVFQLYPYASVYLGAEGMLGGEARDRVAGFLAALGRTTPPEPDHLAFMLATYAELSARGRAEVEGRRHEAALNARAAFLWEHLLSWLPAYLHKLSDVAPPFYRRWGEVLMAALLEEAETFEPPAALPLHLREAPAMADPRTSSADEFLQTLLAPARSGIILTRSDLSRAARTLGVGLRAGERKFALKSLLGQDAPGALALLAEEAARQAAAHRGHAEALPHVAAWWAARAEATATLLRELKAEA